MSAVLFTCGGCAISCIPPLLDQTRKYEAERKNTGSVVVALFAGYVVDMWNVQARDGGGNSKNIHLILR